MSSAATDVEGNQIPSWLEEKWDKELGLKPLPLLTISYETQSAESATTKGLLENALNAQQEGRNVQALEIFAELLQLRLDNRGGFKKQASTMTSSHSRVEGAPFATPMLIRLTVKRILWVLYQELSDLVPKPQSFTPSIYDLLHDAPCVYLEQKGPELTHILPLAEFLSIHYPKLAESLYKVMLKTIDHVSESDKKEALPVAQKLADLYFSGDLSLSRNYKRGLAVSPAMPNWQEQQNVFCRALTDMELSLGYDHLDVLSYCSRLGEFYLRHGLDIDAERLFLRIYQGQRSVMGDGHQDTFRSLIKIYHYYVDQERYLEAEALIQAAIVGTETIDTNHNTMSFKFRIMGCSTSLQAKLASLCTPGQDYYWQDSRMYLRSFYEISLVPSLPPEIFPRRPVNVTVEGARKPIFASESLSIFNFLSDANLSTMKYTLEQQDVSTITLTVPYKRLCLRIKDNPRLPVLVPWVLDYDMPSVDADLIKNRQIEGFFNNIPGDSGLLDLNNELGGFSLVSSSWIDWKNFTVYQVAPSHNPRLISNGKCMKCHGYIMGTWTEKSLRSQWTGIPIFIVDAIFTERESNKICNFILNPGVVGAHNQHELLLVEKRFFVSHLNSTLFRYAPPEMRLLGSDWRMPRPSRVSVTTVNDLFWDEMNRREKWDREHERKLKTLFTYDRADLEKKQALDSELETKNQERKQWDAEHAGPANSTDGSRRMGCSLM